LKILESTWKLHRNSKSKRRTLWILHVIFIMFCPSIVLGNDLLESVKQELTSRDWQVRLSAVERLSGRDDGETVNLLIRVAENRNEDWKVQRKAIQLLGEAGDPKAIDLLTFILNSNTSDWKCPALQSTAAIALGSFKRNKHVTDALVQGTQDNELIIREASITSLGRIGNPAVIQYLLPFLQDENVALRLNAIKALKQIGDPIVVSTLRDVSDKDSDDSVRAAAKRALQDFNNIKQD
jgi:HEAT repeat protein